MDFIKFLLSSLFPCRFSELRCQGNFFGCRCGKGKSQKKVEARADDLARQQAAQAAQTQAAVQAGTAPTPQEQERINATFGLEQRRLPGLEGRANALPEDLIRQLGPESAQYLDIISRRLGMTPAQLFGEISPTASTLQQTIQGRLQNPPAIPFEDVFQPEYQLLKQNVLADAARRGFGTGSGLEIEQLGRAGVELAIRQAGLRQQNAQINQQLRQQSLEDASNLISNQYGLGQEARQEAGGLTEFGAGLSQQARAELANYLSNQQTLSEAARGRQTQGLQASYSLNQPALQRAAGFNELGLSALNNRVQQSRQTLQSLGSLAGTIAAIAAAGPTGGASLFAIPSMQGNAGSVGGLLSGMHQANANYSSLPAFGNAGGVYQTGGSFGRFFGAPRSLIGVDEAEALRRLGYGSRIA